MKRIIFCCCTILIFASCSPTPFRVQSVPPKETAAIADSHESFEARIDAALAERYRQKKKPSFALINGYYRLPEAHPYGAATIVRSYSYQTYVEEITVNKKQHQDAITPMSGDDAQSYADALQALLDAGVVIKEIGMTDALAIAKAEQEALKSDKSLSNVALPPNVDYLISIYPAQSTRGPILIGRVIKRDGTLMAFRVMHRGGGHYSVGSLITTLFEDTIRRI